MRFRIYPSLAVFLALVGCDQQNNTSNLEARIISLEADVKALKDEQNINRLTSFVEQTAYLTPGGEGYSPLKFDLGTLTVKIKDVASYANGSKITLMFGNTLSSAINGLKLTIDYGSVNSSGYPDYSKAKTKTVTLNDVLEAGAWTNVGIVLEGVPSDSLGFIRISKTSHTGISLTKPQ